MSLIADNPILVGEFGRSMQARHVELTPPVEPAGGGNLRRSLSNIGWGVVGVVSFVALWGLGTRVATSVPSPAQTWSELRQLFAHPFHDGGPNDKGVALLVKNSLGRVLSGFVIAVAAGIPLGLAMGSSRRLRAATNPVVQLLRPISPLAWFPIWLFAIKDAASAAVWVIFITAVWPIVLNSATGAATVPIDQRNVAKVFKMSKVAYVRHILLPHSLPSIVTGMRLSMGTAWMVIVAVEMLSTQVGIGGYVWETYNALNLARVAAVILVIGAVGLLLDLVFLRLARLVSTQEVLS